MQKCVACGERFSVAEDQCPVCDLEVGDEKGAELGELAIATRVLDQLLATGKLSAESKLRASRAIEERRTELHRVPAIAPSEPIVQGSVQHLEACFGADRGESLGIEQKKRALAQVRVLDESELRRLSANALLGIAQLQKSLGLLSRAAHVYEVFFECYPGTSITASTAFDALETAQKLGDDRVAGSIIEAVLARPALLVKNSDLADLIQQLQTRRAHPSQAGTAPAVAMRTADASAGTFPALQPLPAVPEHSGDGPATVTIAASGTPVPAIEPGLVKTPPVPRRSFAEWIGVFMEESNILWGELIGGTLIVGCSIALVISLWQTLEQIPFFPFLIFAAITGALFGAGLYTLHHWKLESTSRGLLLIGTLLVPLNFLVLAGLSRGVEGDLLEYVTEIGTLALFGWLLQRSSRILIAAPLGEPSGIAWLIPVSMLVSAGSLLCAPRWLADDHGTIFYVLSLLPVVVLGAVMASILVPLSRLETWNVGRLVGLLIALGIVTFACGITLGFLLFSVENLPLVLPELSPALTLLGIPILVTGFMSHRKLIAPVAEGEISPVGSQRGLWAMLGTALALLGLFIMAGGFILSVERPELRWLSGATNILVLVAVAYLLRVPALHVAAQVYLAILVVVVGSPDIDTLIRSPGPAYRLAALLVVQSLLAEVWLRLRRPIDAHYYAVGSAVSTALAGILILRFAPTDPVTAAVVLGIAAVNGFGVNLRWRFAAITYASSVVLAGAVFFAVQAFHPAPFAEQLLWSVLKHATFCLVVSAVLRFTRKTRDVDWLRDSFGVPLQFASLFATFLAAGVVLFEQLQFSLDGRVSSVAWLWLACLWLALASLEAWPLLFGGFQTAVCLAWLFGASAWLKPLGWDSLEPYSLHVFALGLGAIGILTECVRLRVRGPTAVALLSPPWLAVDRVISWALILGSFVLVVSLDVWGVAKELGEPGLGRFFPTDWYTHAFSLEAWLVPAVLGGVVAFWLRTRTSASSWLALTLLLVSVPFLAAGTGFNDELATASALRWGLVSCFGLCSILLWSRARLDTELAGEVPTSPIRGLLLGTTVLPILAISVVAVVRRLTNLDMGGPLGGIFAQMGGPISLLTPLVMLSVLLAGHGVRERLTPYLLASAGLANVSAIGAFFLALPPHRRGELWVVPSAMLLAAATAWVCSIAWIGLALLRDRGERRGLLDSALLTLNCACGTVFFGMALLPAFVWLISQAEGEGRQLAQVVGEIWTWLVYMVMASGLALLQWQRRGAVQLDRVGALGLVAIVLCACSAERLFPDSGFPTLMFLSGLYSCIWVGVMMLVEPEYAPRWLGVSNVRGGTVVALVAAGLAIFQGCLGREPIWSTEAIGLAGVCFGMLAYDRKRELWSSLASGVLVLASVVLAMHLVHEKILFPLQVVQLALAVLGVLSLARLGLQRFIMPSDTRTADLRQLPLQIAVGVLGNAALLSMGGVVIVLEPNRPGDWLQPLASAAGWVALLPNVIAAVWYTSRVYPRAVAAVVTSSGLLIGILLAGAADTLIGGEWLAHHVLAGAWTVLGFIVVIVSWVSQHQTAMGPSSWREERRAHLADIVRTCFDERSVRACALWCIAGAGLLTLQAAAVKPETPYWTVGNLVALITLLGTLAVWSRNSLYVYTSGFLFNLLGLELFATWSANRERVIGIEEGRQVFYGAQILGCALGSMVWSFVERLLWRKNVELKSRVPYLYSQLALLAGIVVLAFDVAIATAFQFADQRGPNEQIWVWLLPILLLAGVLLEMWRPVARRFTCFQLYLTGLTAIGMTLLSLHLSLEHWLWGAIVSLACYVLLNVVLLRVACVYPSIQETVPLRVDPTLAGHWFWHTQILTVALVLASSFWISLDYSSLWERLGGPLAAFILLPVGVLFLAIWPIVYPKETVSRSFGVDHWVFPYYLVLAIGVVIAVEAGWSWIEPEATAVWLQRNAVLLSVVVAAALLYRYAPPYCVAGTSWLEPARSLGAALAGMGVALTVVLVTQEFMSYDFDPLIRTTPLFKPLAVLAGLALLGLTACSLDFALTKDADRYGMEGERRSIYVYLAELLAFALAAHARLNIPILVPPLLGRYWYLSVMVLAFVALAASEIFARRRSLAVLVAPLKHTALFLAFIPVFSFRVGGWLAIGLESATEGVPGLQPFVMYLKGLADNYAMEALCWALLGIFFGWVARLRRSENLGIIGALALTFGAWVLLGHQDATTFLQRPQLWLIPLGVIILLAEHVNRERLGFWASLWVRYGGLLCIYLSSTIEMFKDGLNIYLAIVLVCLAVVGMLLGILFRVRAFLLSGFMALLVVVFAQIWNAAVGHGHTWIWWACGIILGVVILALFALFEKHRNEVLKMLDTMKRWN